MIMAVWLLDAIGEGEKFDPFTDGWVDAGYVISLTVDKKELVHKHIKWKLTHKLIIFHSEILDKMCFGSIQADLRVSKYKPILTC